MIRKAEIHEYDRVLEFYYRLIDDMQASEYHPKWQKGIYPSEKELKLALENSELFIYEQDEKIISVMRVNHETTDGYDKISWAAKGEKEEITVIHMLGVSVAAQRKGIAKQMVRFVINKAEAEKQKAIRLDVLVGNIPANRLYEALGFEYRGTVSLFYEDTGLTDFELYELIL